jgi:DNA (cytosine-5)-methyltransferase 1
MGLKRAGFDVTGYDVEHQPAYPFIFRLRDIRLLERVQRADLLWASPPRQGFTAYKRRKNHVRPRENLIPHARKLCQESGALYIIENVPGAPLINPVMLCGSMFGLDVQRHRLFETNFPVPQPKCDHSIWKPRFPPATNRTNLRKTVEVGVWRIPLDVQRKAMGIDWMTREELSEAIPPAYSEYLARYAIKNLKEKMK